MGSYPGEAARPALAGTGRVGDDMYLIAHHEASGRPCLSPRAAGIGLAGGLLAELLTAPVPALTLDHGCVLPLYRNNGNPVARYTRPDDPVTARVLEVIAAEARPRPVRDWLLFLGRTSAAQVAGRLERGGYLTRPGSRIWWRTPPPVPADVSWSVCAQLRARAALDTARPPTPYAALLAGLAVAAGLGFRFTDLPDAQARSAREAARVLPLPLQELIAHVQASADAAVLSART